VLSTRPEVRVVASELTIRAIWSSDRSVGVHVSSVPAFVGGLTKADEEMEVILRKAADRPEIDGEALFSRESLKAFLRDHTRDAGASIEVECADPRWSRLLELLKCPKTPREPVDFEVA
jgi:hypothetical protein